VYEAATRCNSLCAHLVCFLFPTVLSYQFLVSTTDFFYPLVEDPYAQGRIAACNVLSDIYAMGVVEVDTVLMILGVSKTMTPKERDIITTEMIRGFAGAYTRPVMATHTRGGCVRNTHTDTCALMMQTRAVKLALVAQVARPC